MSFRNNDYSIFTFLKIIWLTQYSTASYTYSTNSSDNFEIHTTFFFWEAIMRRRTDRQAGRWAATGNEDPHGKDTATPPAAVNNTANRLRRQHSESGINTCLSHFQPDKYLSADDLWNKNDDNNILCSPSRADGSYFDICRIHVNVTSCRQTRQVNFISKPHHQTRTRAA